MEDMSRLAIKIDGQIKYATEGQSIVEAARENHIYIPTLCDYKSLKPAGTCRVCTVKIGGKPMAACTTQVANGMEIENNTKEIVEVRKAIIEMLFAEGNHMCPTCEKSGDCELQAVAYRYRMTVSRFPYLFPDRKIDASNPKLLIEHNRCIQCLRCVRGIKTKDGQNIFGFAERGKHLKITIDPEKMAELTDEMAQEAMNICPVGALIVKKKGFSVPIGEHKFDKTAIGSDVEQIGEKK